jgi:hypothetical protein
MEYVEEIVTLSKYLNCCDATSWSTDQCFLLICPMATDAEPLTSVNYDADGKGNTWGSNYIGKLSGVH